MVVRIFNFRNGNRRNDGVAMFENATDLGNGYVHLYSRDFFHVFKNDYLVEGFVMPTQSFNQLQLKEGDMITYKRTGNRITHSLFGFMQTETYEILKDVQKAAPAKILSLKPKRD